MTATVDQFRGPADVMPTGVRGANEGNHDSENVHYGSSCGNVLRADTD